MKKTLKLALLAALSFSLVACGEPTPSEGPSTSTTPTEPAPTDKPTAVVHALTVEVKGTTKVDSTITFIATLDNSPLAQQDKVTYTCSDAEAMEITGNKAVLKKAGTFTMTASTVAADGQTVTTTFEVVATQGYQYTDIATAMQANPGDEITVKGVVSAFVPKMYNNNPSANGYYVSDATGCLYVYDYASAEQVELGDEIIIKGTADVFYNAFQMKFPTELLEKTGTGVATPEPTYAIESTIAEFTAKPDVRENHNKTYKIHGKLTKTVTTYTKYTLTDSTGNINIYSQTGDAGCPELSWLDQYLDKELDFAYTLNGYKNKWRGVVTYVWGA